MSFKQSSGFQSCFRLASSCVLMVSMVSDGFQKSLASTTGAHLAHKRRPQKRQWCRRRKVVKAWLRGVSMCFEGFREVSLLLSCGRHVK